MKDSRVNVRVPQAEKDVWEATAKQFGMTLSEMVTRSVRSTVLNLQQTGTTTTGGTGFVRWDTNLSSSST